MAGVGERLLPKVFLFQIFVSPSHFFLVFDRNSFNELRILILCLWNELDHRVTIWLMLEFQYFQSTHYSRVYEKKIPKKKPNSMNYRLIIKFFFVSLLLACRFSGSAKLSLARGARSRTKRRWRWNYLVGSRERWWHDFDSLDRNDHRTTTRKQS